MRVCARHGITLFVIDRTAGSFQDGPNPFKHFFSFGIGFGRFIKQAFLIQPIYIRTHISAGHCICDVYSRLTVKRVIQFLKKSDQISASNVKGFVNKIDIFLLRLRDLTLKNLVKVSYRP